MDSQISYSITHDNMIHLQIEFYKIHKSKTCHFWKIMQITPYSISSNYKLFMVAFNNFPQMQSKWMEAPLMYAQHVEQLFVLLDLGHTCDGSISQMTSWLNCPQNILMEQSPPHMTFAYLLTEYASDFKVVACCIIWPFHQREFVILNSL